MAAPMVKTKTPGVFKRGGRYVVVYRDHDGKQRKESRRTYDEARRLKAERNTQVASGEFQAVSRDKFGEYALAWVDDYRGTGKRGFREQTRDEYRRDLRRYALPYFGAKRLTEITPRDVDQFIAWLLDEGKQKTRHEVENRQRAEVGESKLRRPPALADASVRRILSPVRACFSTAVRLGDLRHNPAAGAVLPAREEIVEDEEQDVRVFTREQLAVILTTCNPTHRTLLRLLAATGLRISEALALRWRDVEHEGSRPVVKVRRRLRHGEFAAPKSTHSRRDVPIGRALAKELRARQQAAEAAGLDDLVFPSAAGTPIDADNLRRRVLRPVVSEAGAEWAGFHAFRHTRASLLIADGRNIVQVSRWLGHSDPGFTARVYAHLIDGDMGEGADLDSEIEQGQQSGNQTHTDTLVPTTSAQGA